jgi:hypothetical protein
MLDLNTRLTAQNKLRELRRQREELLGHYAALERDSAAAPTPREQLLVLYRGLRDATFAQRSLHPDVANLEALLFEAELGTASAEMLDQWLRRLRRELAAGRLRAEFAHIFGHLLDEWMTQTTEPPAPAPAGPHPFDATLELLWAAPEMAPNLELLRGLFDRHKAAFKSIRSQVRAFAAKEAQAPVTPEHVRALLKTVSNDITRRPDLRQQAMALASDPMQTNELAGTLTILLHNLDRWAWPVEGFALRPLWSRTKWRPYLDEDLLTQLFQALVGLRWGIFLKGSFERELSQPGGKNPFGGKQHDHAARHFVRWQQHVRLFLPMIPHRLEALSDRDGYAGGYSGSGLTPDSADTFQQQLVFVNAEIRLARAEKPDAPLYVVQADLRDYYLRVPHEVALCLLEGLGFPRRWRAFFRKFLAVPGRHAGALRTVRRGLMLDHVISDVLAEYLLLLMDLHVFGAGGVRPIRVVDDIFLVADSKEAAVKAWQALQEFCAATGLEVNDSKAGSVCLGGEPAPELPQGPPRWGMLRLTAEGAWELDGPSWERFQAILRRQLSRPMPVLTLISIYNDALRYILKFLGFLAPLGPAHREQIAQAVAQMHNSLFGEGCGVLEEARRRGQGGAAHERLPEALFYWPLTAGGLGLFNPVAALAAYHQAALDWKEPQPPGDGRREWQAWEDPWLLYLQGWLNPIQPATPAPTPGLEALLADFVARSGEVAGKPAPERKNRRRRKQRVNLSVYWQWVVYTYGPQLLDALGTFRFLITELVPLQLIVLNRIAASSLHEETDAGLLNGDVK